MRTAGRVGVLLALWLLAWGEVSVANLVSGVAAAAALLVAFPPGPRAPGSFRFSAVGIARLAAYVAVQLVVANANMTRRTLSRHPALHGGVLAHRLREPSEQIVTLMTSVISLSPGTMTVDVDGRSETIFVHFLDLPDIAAGRASLAHLEALCVAAIAAHRAAPDQTSEDP